MIMNKKVFIFIILFIIIFVLIGFVGRTFLVEEIELEDEVVLSLLADILPFGDKCEVDGLDGVYDSCVINISQLNDQWFVEVIYDGLHDDSVRSMKTQVNIIYQDGQWLVGEAVSTQRCWFGRGSQEFSAELCI